MYFLQPFHIQALHPHLSVIATWYSLRCLCGSWKPIRYPIKHFLPDGFMQIVISWSLKTWGRESTPFWVLLLNELKYRNGRKENSTAHWFINTEKAFVKCISHIDDTFTQWNVFGQKMWEENSNKKRWSRCTGLQWGVLAFALISRRTDKFQITKM